jgi:hypothetical protein
LLRIREEVKSKNYFFRQFLIYLGPRYSNPDFYWEKSRLSPLLEADASGEPQLGSFYLNHCPFQGVERC